MRNARSVLHFLCQLLLVVLLLAVAAMLWARPVHLMNSDLGRHLQNGAVILAHWHVPEVNLYSYTFPDFPVINHHWGTGVVFHLLSEWFGLQGLVFFMIGVELLLLLCLILFVTKRSGFWAMLPAATLAVSFITWRAEIRPEIFSGLLLVLFLAVLYLCTNERWRNGLFALPVFMIFWVNLHVYFFLGIAVTFCFFLDEAVAVQRRQGSKIVLRALGQSLVLQAFASFMNPSGITGALVPFMLPQNFGYMLAENQPIWFLGQRGLFPQVWIYAGVLLVVTGFWVWYLWTSVRANRRFPLASLLLFIAFTAMGAFGIRNIGLWGIVLLVVSAEMFAALPLPHQTTRVQRDLFGAIAALLVLLAIYLMLPLYWIEYLSSANPYVFQVEPGVTRFFKEQKLTGPIFNNYDSGGGLIYALYPQEKVFVDNRPEAYPASFFSDTYIPMQEDEAVWKQQEQAWKFNAIIFYRRDLTPWAQKFLISRVKDPWWAPVYVDDDSILFLRKNPQNSKVIDRYQIPLERFKVST